MPKERFSSYPDASRDGTPLPGWAGFDALQGAEALTRYLSDRIEYDGWGVDRVTPLLAGLAELLAWIGQWHDEIDPMDDQAPAGATRAHSTAGSACSD